VGPLVDVGSFPLVVVRWPAGVVSDEQVEEMLRTLASFYGRKHAVLHDGLRLRGMSAAQRERIAQHTESYEREIRGWVVASAAVAPSLLVRGFMLLIQWVAPAPCPFKAFDRYDDAEAWLREALRRARLWRPTTEAVAAPQ